MIDLKCKLESCKHNKASNCTARKIEVDDVADCTTFCQDKEKTLILKKKGHKDNIPMPLIRGDVKVGCDAHCLFNKNHVCIANGITVATENKSAQCTTFMPE